MSLALAPQNDPSGSKLLGRRSLARVPLDLALRIHVAGLSGPLPARSRDLGVGGLCIATPSCFALGELRKVSLLHPTTKLDLVAEGRWQTEVPGRDAFLSGIRFPEVDGRTLDRLWDLVHDQTKHLSRWLSQHSDLKALALGDLIELIHVMRLRDMASGETVYRPESKQHGDDSILVVTTGRIVLEARVASGRKISLGEVGRGQIRGRRLSRVRLPAARERRRVGGRELPRDLAVGLRLPALREPPAGGRPRLDRRASPRGAAPDRSRRRRPAQLRAAGD